MSEDLRQFRVQKRERLRDEGVAVNPDRFERTHTLAEAMHLSEGTTGVRAAGRLVQLRRFGKLTFGTLQDLDGHIQIALAQDGLSPDPAQSERLYRRFLDVLDRWDFVGVEGEIFRTKTAELTIRVKELTFLGKALLPPPNKYQGSRDLEINWRHRYIDLISNADTRQRFQLRARVVRSIRRYLEDNRFVEVDTPILCNQQSGALARPFFSHHNALNMEVVLRIAPETYLKRLIVGGYDRVFEFARCFRNEGLAASHLQEFTMLEFYAAYWNYEDNMSFTENLIRNVVREATGSLEVRRGDSVIDFAQPWPRITLRDAIYKACGIDIDALATADELRKAIAAKGVELENPTAGRGGLIDQLYKRTARPSLIQPTFIICHPIDLSPLARRSDGDARTADRFQLVVDTWELLNAYSELVDPIDQRQRLEEQASLRSSGDDEAMPLDEEYLMAMEYGMPPISGWGMGIDRFVALLSGAPNLRDVVWFPLMKPLTPGESTAQARSDPDPEP